MKLGDIDNYQEDKHGGLSLQVIWGLGRLTADRGQVRGLSLRVIGWATLRNLPAAISAKGPVPTGDELGVTTVASLFIPDGTQDTDDLKSSWYKSESSDFRFSPCLTAGIALRDRETDATT